MELGQKIAYGEGMGDRNTPLSGLWRSTLIERERSVQPLLHECDPKLWHAEETEDGQDRIMGQRRAEPKRDVSARFSVRIGLTYHSRSVLTMVH